MDDEYINDNYINDGHINDECINDEYINDAYSMYSEIMQMAECSTKEYLWTTFGCKIFCTHVQYCFIKITPHPNKLCKLVYIKDPSSE